MTRYFEEIDRRVLYTELRNLSAPDGFATILQARGFEYQPHLNLLIALDKPADKILQDIGPRTRKHIRRAHKTRRVKIAELQNPSELHNWYALLQKTYARAGVPLADISLFRAAFAELTPAGMCKFWLANVDDAPAACSLELMHGNTLYGWYGGTDRAFSSATPNEALVWHILEWGSQNGYEHYDWGGAGTPGQAYGVRNFKLKFGGAPVEYGRFVRVHSPRMLKASRFGYRVLARTLFGRIGRQSS
jgi:lipid II:glycine glycyltransferase (peptidoglycan interpeptide bridge formation enzyme)